ncbi:hypothetical protein LX87_01977 [Larkinella arboricola]|uniref:Uncharacterized protein n=1 Tax=Larkinella arboricola TaxID=643671 RepID=A0A327X9D3_LARAB|nr:hypothetical protein [Larkinella arboricola]RAK00277.1 hypothetical protein LX87_01977 [Larkinella arboricola]
MDNVAEEVAGYLAEGNGLAGSTVQMLFLVNQGHILINLSFSVHSFRS